MWAPLTQNCHCNETGDEQKGRGGGNQSVGDSVVFSVCREAMDKGWREKGSYPLGGSLGFIGAIRMHLGGIKPS